MKWTYTCHLFKEVRELINDDVETAEHCIEILKRLRSCCELIINDHKKGWGWSQDFFLMKCDIDEALYETSSDDNYDTCEETVNYLLGEFYDLCDNAGIWLGF